MNIDELMEKARLTDTEIWAATNYEPNSTEPLTLQDGRRVVQAQQQKDFSLVVKEAGVCSKCKGDGEFYLILPDGVSSPNLVKCSHCHGIGKTAPFTVKDLIGRLEK